MLLFVILNYLSSCRKLWANLLAATLGAYMCRPLGPVPLVFRAYEPVSSRKCPYRSHGAARGGALHGGRDRRERRRKQQTLLLGLLMQIFYFECVLLFLGLWVWHSSTYLWPPIQSPNHSYHPYQVSSYIILFLSPVVVCVSDISLSFIWQSDRVSESGRLFHRHSFQTRSDQAPLHHCSSGSLLGRSVFLFH